MSKILRQSTLLFIVCLALVQFSSSYAEGVFSWLFSSSSKTDAKQQLFSRIPADTSWIMANVKRMPEKVAEAWLEKIQYIINSYLVLITKPAREEPDKKGLKRLTGLLEFAKDKLTPDKLEEIGLRIDPYIAFYGNKLMPSLRMELSDGAKLKAEIDKAFNEANKLSHPASSSTTISKENPAEQLQWISEGELHYLHFKHPKGVQNNLEEEGRDESYLDVIVAIEPKWLSLGFVEAGNSKQLKRFLGKAKLEQPLRAETISQLSKDYGYNGLGQGYLDTRKFYQQISAIALASKKTDEDVKKQLQSCDKLANLTFDHLPRIIIGMTQFSETTFAQQMLFELSADVVESLKSVPTAWPVINKTRYWVLALP